MSSIIASATCAVASVVRNRRAVRPPASFPELLRIAVTRSGRVLCIAGKSPNAMPVASDNAAAKLTAAQLTPRFSVDVISIGSIALMPLSVQEAKTRLTRPPIAASTSDSVSSCPTSCLRVAPSERRTAISISRPVARAISRLAMLAQAMRSTSPVIAKSMNSGPPASSPMSLCPLLPSLTATAFSLNCASTESRMFCCSGASTSRMIGR
jgi:hypothetical protein